MKCAICAIIKDEQKFLKEFIDYHLSLGFDDIYLYEDSGSVSHDSITNLYNKVHLLLLEKDTPIKRGNSCSAQINLYKWFLLKAKDEMLFDWVLFTDIDEYLTFGAGYDLQKLTEEYKDYPGVYLDWKLYNANGHIKSPEGSIRENYTQEAKPEEFIDGSRKWRIKSFVNIHNATKFNTIHEIANAVNTDFTTSIYVKPLYDKAWINHYFSKSWEDFCDRILKRGNMANDFRNFDNFFFNNKDLLPLKNKLIESVRYCHTVNTFWISKDLKLISGGNVNKLERLKNKIK